MRLVRLLALWISATLLCGCVDAERPLRLVSTTTTENSGLMGYLLPQYTQATDMPVQLMTMGTGQALRMAENGDVDVLLVHDPAAEADFIARGFGIRRTPIMSNKFYLVGPKDDPANLKSATSIELAMQRIDANNALFISRGDDSGTHKKEQTMWNLADINPRSRDPLLQRQVGAGMGKTLNVAAALNGYTLVDQGTWLSFNNRQELRILFAGDDNLLNSYHLLELSPLHYPHINQQQVASFVNWLAGPQGQHAIDSFRLGGQRLFDPAQASSADAVSSSVVEKSTL